MDKAEALDHAARLLHAAEGETNLALLAELRSLADSWIAVADVLSRESVQMPISGGVIGPGVSISTVTTTNSSTATAGNSGSSTADVE